jgi:3-oxoacyl-[acyl-carrier-protein] synthase II
MQRVVITGIGALTPLGNTFAESWESIKAASDGHGLLTAIGTSDIPWKHAAQLKGFSRADHFSVKDIRRYDPFVLYAAVAAREAAKDSGISDLTAAGIIIGSSRGGISSIEHAVQSRPTAYLMAGTTISMAASFVARTLGIKGHLSGVSTACASGSTAIAEAYTLISSGRMNMAMAGGTDAALCSIALRGYGTAGALSRIGISRPFDSRRDGFTLGEGACVLMLESLENARARKANIYGEITGYGCTTDAGHPTAPSAEGEARAMWAALADAKLAPKDIGLVMAHATSTTLGDSAEAQALQEVFGIIPTCALKSMTGHLLAASGPLELAVACMSLSKEVQPPTINSEQSEFEMKITESSSPLSAEYAITESFGFGGINVVLVLKKYMT